MSGVDCLIRLQALDGTWETCGADRAIGVNPESVQLSANEWGSDKASFDLHRSPIALWPDIGAFTPVEVEIGGLIVWEGRIGETPIRSGAEQVINVQCEGWQYQLDDDVYQRTYVHSKLSDWKDWRSNLSADLTFFTTAAQVQVGAGMISLVWPQGQATNGAAAVVLDLGPGNGAKRLVFDWAITAGANNRSVYVSALNESLATIEVPAVYSATGASSGTFAHTFPSAARYVLIVHEANSHTPTADETLKITKALAFADTAYESGNASVLHASVIAEDAIERATLLLAEDFSEIEATSFPIPDFSLSKASTPREVIEAANAYHNWVARMLIGRRFQFAPRPAAPLLELGAWSGSDIEDASANNGAEIYNRALVEAQGPDGSPLNAERTAGDQSVALTGAVESPAPGNPSFATNTSTWSVSGGTLSRVTGAGEYHSSPAAGKWAASALGQTLTETFSGTFKKGITYRLTLYAAGGGLSASLLSATLGTAGDNVVSQISAGGAYQAFSFSWTPLQDRTGVTLVLTYLSGGANIFIDDLSLVTVEPTLVDRRRFRRTKVIQMSSAITAAEGNQLADIFLQSHMTTPFKGSASVVPGGVRTVLGGQPVHPAALLTRTQELLRLSHLTDPDTGGVGRDGTIAEVAYTHKDQKAAVTLDDKRANFDALLARLAVVQQPGS